MSHHNAAVVSNLILKEKINYGYSKVLTNVFISGVLDTAQMIIGKTHPTLVSTQK